MCTCCFRNACFRHANRVLILKWYRDHIPVMSPVWHSTCTGYISTTLDSTVQPSVQCFVSFRVYLDGWSSKRQVSLEVRSVEPKFRGHTPSTVCTVRPFRGRYELVSHIVACTTSHRARKARWCGSIEIRAAVLSLNGRVGMVGILPAIPPTVFLNHIVLGARIVRTSRLYVNSSWQNDKWQTAA